MFSHPLALLPLARGQRFRSLSALDDLGSIAEALSMERPQQAPAANLAMSFLFHAGCQWRGVAEVRGSSDALT
jgi:hypothetical protein